MATSRIINSDFLLSAYAGSQLADYTLPEVAFVGRSNVGKSSLLNAVCERKSLAVVGKTPGRTQAINLFEILFEVASEEQEPLRFAAHFADLPGFGYAKVSKKLKSDWYQLLNEYLLSRVHLEVLVLLVDPRRELGEEESAILELGDASSVFVVLTKVDKCGQKEIGKSRAILKKLGVRGDSIFSVSVMKNKFRGVEQLRDAIALRLVSSADIG